jgi:dTMP kinase
MSARDPASARFIVIEGIDGSGTTTQSQRLVAELQQSGLDARWTCEPSSGAVGKLIRAALEKRLVAADGVTPQSLDWGTLALLFAADRLDHVRGFVEPALREGAIVVSDRYTLSSLVYQSVTAPEGDRALPWISALNQRALSPHLTLVLDVPAAVAAERRESRGGPEELFDGMSLQERLAAAYGRAREFLPRESVLHVPGTGSSDQVFARIRAATDALLPHR